MRAIYDAFGRGDAAAILATVTDDVDWASDAASDSAPWYGAADREGGGHWLLHRDRRGIEVLDFTPLSFAANESEVMVLIRFRSRSRTSGKEAAMHLHHFWRFRDGKVEYYRGSEDTELTATTLGG